MPKLAIAKNLALPGELATEATAILARRGRGKTYTAAVLAEELHQAGQPFVVLDPVGVWWGLRSSADGQRPGLQVTIIGGEHGDVPLEQTAGTLLATFVVDNPGAYVLDLSGFEVKAAQDRFVADFAERIYRYKAAQERRTPLTLIIDEADQFAPQQPRERGGIGPRMLGAFESIVRQGRARGLGCVLITQRPAVLNKNVLTQAGALVLLGITGPQDRKAIDEWVRGHADEDARREVTDSLAGLGIGEAWVWWPTEELLKRVQVRQRRTFDSSSTPKAGESREVVRFADVNLDTLKEAIAHTVERAKAEDPKLLQVRIRELEKELRQRPSETKVETVIEYVEVPVLDPTLVDRLGTLLLPLQGVLADIFSAMGKASSRPALPSQQPKERPAAPVRAERTRREPAAPTGDLPRGEHRILTAVAQYEDGVTRDQLTVLTGYKRSSRDTYLQRLRERDCIFIRDGIIRATDIGIDALGPDFEPLPAGEELREYWLRELPEGERRILAELIAVWPGAMSKDDLSERTGYKRSSRDTYLQRLRSRQLVYTDGGEARAADVLFEESA